MKDVIIHYGTAVATFNTEYAATLSKEEFMKHYKPSHFSGFDEQEKLLNEAWDQVQTKLEQSKRAQAGSDGSDYNGAPILTATGEVTGVTGGSESGALVQSTPPPTPPAGDLEADTSAQGADGSGAGQEGEANTTGRSKGGRK